MSNKLFILSFNLQSKSFRALAEGLGIKKIRHKNSKFVGEPNKTVINWGYRGSHELFRSSCKVINSRPNIERASNKKFALVQMHKNGVSLPQFSTSLDNIGEWRNGIGLRHKLNGHGGEGIEIVDDPRAATRGCNLYVEYIKKAEEFRVHVHNGVIFDVQRKALRKHDAKGNVVIPANVDWQVRNHKNWFIYARNNINLPEDIEREALKAVRALHLDFGAVELIWNKHRNKSYVLEVNTAPGLEGTTLEKYINEFKLYA